MGQRRGEDIYAYQRRLAEHQIRLSKHAMIGNIGMMVCAFLGLVLLLFV